MARTTVRVQLKTGSLSASTRRRGLFFVLAVALLWRGFLLWRVTSVPDALGATTLDPGMLGPFLGQDQGLMSFLTQGWWVGSPVYLFFCALEHSLGLHGQGLLILQALFGVIGAVVLYRFAVPWLGFLAAMISSILFSVTITSAFGGLMLLPGFLFAWASLHLLRHLVSVARLREPERCFSTGLAIGGLSLLGGLGAAWLIFALAWLPTRSQYFRGRDFVRMSWRMLAGFVLVLSPVLVQGLMAHGSFLPPFANLPGDLAAGIRSPHVVHALDEQSSQDPALRYEKRRQESDAGGGNAFTQLADAWSAAPDPIVTGIRRARAFLGGTHDPGSYLDAAQRDALGVGRIPTTSVVLLCALAWLGGFALLGSLRSFAPLYFGVGVPLFVAMGCGVSPQTWMMALPFLCLLAGYGFARIWLARRSLGTWLAVFVLLGLGYLLTRGV